MKTKIMAAAVLAAALSSALTSQAEDKLAPASTELAPARTPQAEAPAQEKSELCKCSVAADKLNARVKPGLGRSVVAVLQEGDQLEAKSVQGAWLEIKAPKSTAVWVANCFLAGGELKPGANLRAGPSVAYDLFGTAKEPEKIRVVDSAKQGWTRIEPPSWLLAYVSAKHVKIAKEDFDKLLAAAPKTPDDERSMQESALARTASSVPEPSAQKGKEQPDVAGAERSVVVEGILLPVRDSRSLATHALAAEVNGEYHPLCYLRSANFNLQLWERRKVRIKGSQRWVGDWRRPLVDIELITPIWQ